MELDSCHGRGRRAANTFSNCATGCPGWNGFKSFAPRPLPLARRCVLELSSHFLGVRQFSVRHFWERQEPSNGARFLSWSREACGKYLLELRHGVSRMERVRELRTKPTAFGSMMRFRVVKSLSLRETIFSETLLRETGIDEWSSFSAMVARGAKHTAPHDFRKPKRKYFLGAKLS